MTPAEQLAHPCLECRVGPGAGCRNYLAKGKPPCPSRGRPGLRAFLCRQLAAAEAWAEAGGQALHLHTIIPCRKKAPQCFVRAVDRGEWIAHFFDRDRDRLIATARRFGVRDVYVDRDGTDAQHVDLCGDPLRAALRAAENGREVPPRPGGLAEQPSLFDTAEAGQ